MPRKKRAIVHECSCDICQAHPRSDKAKEHRAINRLLGSVDEKARRHFAGLLAWQWGRGGLERVREITGLSRPTIRRGRKEVQRVERVGQPSRVRKEGGGRPATEKNNRVS